ncbi:MAG TPA: DUF5808 domain-containing protein [Thermomicrobiales bacterium]|nr:DUF5808 domain-containing protein [Thermomicrobiales bacterium]
MSRRNRLIALGVVVLFVVALLDQLGRHPEDRDWHGKVLGFPYDFRMPTLERLQQRVWNPDDERIIVPHVVGIGWTVNLYQLKRRLQLLIA